MPYVKTNGIRLYYEESGQGEPLLLLMGITAPGSVWEKHVAHWRNRFRCIMPDNRGVGRTSQPRGPYTSALMADDHAGLLTALGIAKARVIGCSMGSIIAQQLALRHPDKVRSLVLMCPWARCDRHTEALFHHLMAIRKTLPAEEFTRFIQWLIFSRRTWEDPAAQQELQAAHRGARRHPPAQTPAALAAQAAACVSHNTLGQLPQIGCPTLVIGGRRDIFTPPWMAQEVVALIPGAACHLYPEAGHAFHWERLADFNARVRRWLLRCG